MAKSKLRIGYIARSNVGGKSRFVFHESSYTRRITARGDRVYSDMLLFPVDYEDVALTTSQIKEKGVIVITEPFFLDDELRDKVINWIEWANSVDQKEYDPFAE
jgi:hypothetical protein